MHIPNLQDLYSAHEVLKPVINRTPLLNSPFLDEYLNARIFMKAEMFQHTGAFKFRGAYNGISRLDKKDNNGGVVACSSGNHAQGVAEAARLCGMKATIVMPSDAPSIKVNRTKRSGANIVFYDRETENRDAIAQKLCKETDAVFIHPYDNPHIIAGQGTAGLEIVEQLKEKNATPDYILTPCSGGGLTAGVGIAIKNTWSDAELFCVEPEGFDDYARSIQSGTILKNEKLSGSICDALLTPSPGNITFEINKQQIKKGLTVSDMEVCSAVAFAFGELKLVVEPGGVITLAAILSKKLPVEGKTAVIVLSGGNIDNALHADILKRAEPYE